MLIEKLNAFQAIFSIGEVYQLTRNRTLHPGRGAKKLIW